MKVKVVEVKFVKAKELLRKNKELEASLEQAEIIICRHKDTIDELQNELVEATDKYHQLERAVKTQSSCWMCANNLICHQGKELPQSPDIACGSFKFGYKASEKHSDTVCDYKHGKVCWAQKGAPLCDPVFCPVKEKRPVENINFVATE